LYKALLAGSYRGEWFIPTSGLLCGVGGGGRAAQEDNIIAHRDRGALKDSFCVTSGHTVACPNFYWSSTEHFKDNYISAYFDDFRYAEISHDASTPVEWLQSCRPVRLAEVKP
jgi:hypothetical protein